MSNSTSIQMMTNCAIRKAHPDEADTLSQLARRSKAYWGYSDTFMAACEAELNYTASQIETEQLQFMVMQRKERCIGFYALERITSTTFSLEALFVEPRYIGQGYGRALMEHAKTNARRQGASTLRIQGDPNAQRFYLAAGAKIVGRKESDSIPGRFLPLFSLALTNK